MRPSVVICGTYHIDSVGLQRIFRELNAAGCRVLSPISVIFKDTSLAIVRAEYEDDLSIDMLQRFHIRALCSADFMWLHAPGGHVGISASYELDYASAIHKPVFFTFEQPADEMLATRVQVVGSVIEALEQLSITSF